MSCYERHFLYILICSIIVSFLAGCNSATNSNSPLLEGQWQLEGLSDVPVTVLETDGNKVLVGTEKGLFRWNGSELSSLGLNKSEISGIVRLKDDKLLAASLSESPDLLLSRDNGDSWESFEKNFGGKQKDAYINSLKPFTQFSDTLFTIGGCGWGRSLNGGESWEPISGSWDSSFGLYSLLYIEPYPPHRIWMGGVTGISQPVLWKSIDVGNSWQYLKSIIKVNGTITEAVAYDVITHPQDTGLVLAGLGGAIEDAKNVRKSTDGGQSWRIVLKNTGIHTFTRSLRNIETVYASGRDSADKLFYAVTPDFGETWEKVIYEEGPSSVIVNDLVVQTVGGSDVLLLATNRGLYSFTFEE